MTPKKHINNFLVPNQSRDNPANLFMFIGFFFSPIYVRRSRKGFCRNPRGISPTEFPSEISRGFFFGFFGPFSLEKKRRKNPPKNPRQFSNQNLGVSGPKSTLQGSDLCQTVWNKHASTVVCLRQSAMFCRYLPPKSLRVWGRGAKICKNQ